MIAAVTVWRRHRPSDLRLRPSLPRHRPRWRWRVFSPSSIHRRLLPRQHLWCTRAGRLTPMHRSGSMRYSDTHRAGQMAPATATRMVTASGPRKSLQTYFALQANGPAAVYLKSLLAGVIAPAGRVNPNALATACTRQGGGLLFMPPRKITRHQGMTGKPVAAWRQRWPARHTQARSIRRQENVTNGDRGHANQKLSTIDTNFGLEHRELLLRGSASWFRIGVRPGMTDPLSGAGSSGRCKGD